MILNSLAIIAIQDKNILINCVKRKIVDNWNLFFPERSIFLGQSHTS
jgi:hypothetical protein